MLRRGIGWFVLFTFVAAFSFGAEGGPSLTVGDSGASLYARQDIHSEKLATLQKGEQLVPLAEAVGTTTWYMVQTRGLIGWVLGSEVVPSTSLREALKEQQVSTWSAVANNGRTYDGTYTVERNPASGEVSGGWTLHDQTGKIVARGTWSARKFSTGWNGTWRAFAEDQPGERTGSWTADLRLPASARLQEMFEAATQNAVRGVWASGRESGSWLIRGAK